MDPVLIIGGGLAGLTLANVLKENGVPYRVFERDASPSHRTQGWSINIQFALSYLQSGLNPVKYSQLSEKAAVNPQAPWQLELTMVNARKPINEVLAKFDFSQLPAHSIRINRGRFRDWLLEGIDVEWNKEFETIEEHVDGVSVKFKDGTSVNGSLVVGADGTRSRVCQHRLGKDTFWNSTTTNPVLTLAGTVHLTEEEYKPLETLSRTLTVMFAGDDNRTFRGFNGLIDYDPQRAKPYTLQWGVACIDENAPSCDTDAERLALVKEWASRAMDGEARAFYHSIPDGTAVASMMFLQRNPTVLQGTLAQHPRVAVIGDAAHCMTPYRGEGMEM
ncbi:hypothetical protein BCR43DRAFT_493256 [Syncephalastrum racemosum]|uniref:FAD-binding domain-containing protein n=1 Tax=Syncephalastrum racemosum TaxID=13706 RepID=A0A1X2HAA7_SYNRA|nr:hypothetical protein BCR43DRAFT_493256 [Syncephalastrum racemosum]